MESSLSALLPLCPTALSYGVSYLFIAIVWVNHHHLLRFAERATPQLIWWNFAHLFLVSLVPFFTSWVADSHFAATPVSLYAGVFVMVNLAYLAFAWEVLAQAEAHETVPVRMRQMTRARSFTTLGMFVVAMVLSLKLPLWGFALICCVLFAYLWPEGSPRPGREGSFET